LYDNPTVRAIAIALALITDILDGFLARKLHSISQFGAVIDPLSDKFFVVFALCVLVNENNLSFIDGLSMLSRDYAVAIFSLYLYGSGKLKKYHVQAIYSGKITTALQAVVLFMLVLAIPVPSFFFTLCLLLGVAAFVELCISKDYTLTLNHM